MTNADEKRNAKWLPYSGKLTSGYEMANKPEIKKEKKEKNKKERMVEKKRKREKNKTTTLSEKKEEARNVSEQRDKDWIHVIRVHDTVHSADNNTAGQQTLTNYPTQRMSGSLNIETTPLTRTS